MHTLSLFIQNSLEFVAHKLPCNYKLGLDQWVRPADILRLEISVPIMGDADRYEIGRLLP